MSPDRQERRSIATRDEAESFLAAFSRTMGELEEVLQIETREIEAGRIRAGLSQEERKGLLAAGYLQGLEHARANAIAIARFAPEAAARLKDAHLGFRTALEHNQQVLATARAVSEGLVKGVAEEMAKQTRPSGYGVVPPSRPAAGPLVYSGRF